MSSGVIRRKVERLIVEAFVKQALEAGYRLTPSLERGYDRSEGDPLLGSTDFDAIMAEAAAGDDCHIFISEKDGPLMEDGAILSIGWVYLVYGNDGYDVVSDYTTNLDELGLMSRANALAEEWGG